MADSPKIARRHRWLMHHPSFGLRQAADFEARYPRLGRFHRHPTQIQVLIVLEGKLTLQLEAQAPESLRPWDRWAVAPDQMHRTLAAEPGESVRYLDLRLAIEPATPLGAYGQSIADGRRVAGDPHVVAPAITALKALPPDPPLCRCAAAVWNLLCAFEPTIDAAPEPVEEVADARVAAADLVMREHLSQPLSMEELARKVNISPSYLRQLYAEAFNESPAQRLRRLRVEQAAHYLSQSLLSIKEIAYACGFRNVSHFSFAFREQMGQSPRDYRKARSVHGPR